ncbi:hypothetical protein [Knoellia sp. LjRoot47]|uniref:hypothetical protein n=1 Tax=Knoellia sp. LjRoot47 TaxID=3342330 RepID=UPI003ECDBDD6
MRLPRHLAEQLSRVPKSSDGHCEYAPCRVTLGSGDVIDRVYLVEAVSFERVWGSSRTTLDLSDIERIEDSPLRLPVHWANTLYQAGESGMGHTVFTARLRDGSTLPFVVGNAVDFPNWPPGVDPADVVEVLPHAGREAFRHRAPTAYESGAPYDWCVYEAE